MKSSFHDTKSSIYYEWPINSKFIMNVRSTLVSNSISYLQVYNVGTASSVSTFKVYYRFDKHESLLRRKGKTSSDILRRKKGVSKESKDISSLFANESLTAFLDRADIRERGSFTRSFRVSFSIYHLSLSLVRSFVSSFSFSRQPYITFVSV